MASADMQEIIELLKKSYTNENGLLNQATRAATDNSYLIAGAMSAKATGDLALGAGKAALEVASEGAGIMSKAAVKGGLKAGASMIGKYMPFAAAGAFGLEQYRSIENFEKIDEIADEREKFLIHLSQKYKDELASGRKFSAILNDIANAEDLQKLQELNDALSKARGRDVDSMFSTAVLTEGLGEDAQEWHKSLKENWGITGDVVGYSLSAFGVVSDALTDLTGWATRKGIKLTRMIQGKDTSVDDALSSTKYDITGTMMTDKEADTMLANAIARSLDANNRVATAVYTPKELGTNDLARISALSCETFKPIASAQTTRRECVFSGQLYVPNALTKEASEKALAFADDLKLSEANKNKEANEPKRLFDAELGIKRPIV